VSAPQRLYRTPPEMDGEQIVAIQHRRSRISGVLLAIGYAMVFFVPLWVYESRRARRIELALEVQRLQENRRQLHTARQAAAARLEALRAYGRVESAAQRQLGLERVGMDRVLPMPAAEGRK